MASSYVRHTILLPHKRIPKQQGNGMCRTLVAFLVLTPISLISDQPFDHVYGNAALQRFKAERDIIADFVNKSLRERPRRRQSRCIETTFTVKDFQRIGATGLSEMRVIDTSSLHPSFPFSEIHGWKMLSPTTTSNKGPLSLTSYIPTHYKPRRGTIEIEAHFIIPKTDAPDTDRKEYIKLGFWIDCTQERGPIGENSLTFVTSKDVLIPDKGSFNDAKATHISVTIRVKPNAHPKDLFRILFNRIPVSEGKAEFNHKQGIALNGVTVRYPI